MNDIEVSWKREGMGGGVSAFLVPAITILRRENRFI